ncbi:MAG: antitoxin [Actinomycetota bacterium]
MRTTIAIDDEVLGAAKQRARERGITLGELIQGALRRELLADPSTSEAPPVPVFTGGTGPRPGIDLSSNRALNEALDEGLELDRRR